jgi:hypothetical protein
MRRHRAACTSVLFFAGFASIACRQRAVRPSPTLTLTATPEQKAAATASDGEAPLGWSAHLGRCVRVEGYRTHRGKGDPHLQVVPRSIDVLFADPSGAGAWGKADGARVRVQGVVAERADLPVFIPKPGEEPIQGIPVPEGTDLEKARRRFVLEMVSVERLRTREAVEADLTSHIGQDVKLPGMLWSLNGDWWFNHDGVELHLAGPHSVPDVNMHAEPVVLQGRLERRPLPRRDQINQKANPDLADAFVIDVRAMTPHPALPITECTAPDAATAESPVRDSAIVEICHRRGDRFWRCFNNSGDVHAGHISPMGRKQPPLLHVDDGPATADELLRIWRAASAIEPELLTRDDGHAKGATDSLAIRYRDGHRMRLVWRNGGDGGAPSPGTQALLVEMADIKNGHW